MVSLPASPEGLTDLRYSDLQSLAADHGYGRIVGEERKELVEYLAAEAYPRPDVVDSDPDDVDNHEEQRAADQEDVEHALESNSADSESATSDQQRDQRTDGGSAVEQTDSIDVGHEGKEKLSPEGAPNDDKAAVEAPEVVDLGDAGMDDIEPDPEIAGHATSDGQREQRADGDQEDVDESNGGALSKLRGDSSEDEKTSEEIVEEADDPEERQRRDEMRSKLKDAMSGGSSSSPNSDSAESADSAGSESASSTNSVPATEKANGVMIDMDVVEAMIDMPFNTAASMTDWDGWELSEKERKTNAKLFAAVCDEHDVDPSATTMFALSMGSAIGGRAMRYKRATASKDEPAGSSSDPAKTDGGQERATNNQQRTRREDPVETSGSDSDEFDFEDSSTW
jgi:hypothetical protein